MTESPIVPLDTSLMVISPTHAQEIAEVHRDPIVAEAAALVVTTDAEYQTASDFLSGRVGPALKAIGEGCDSVCRATDVAHKAATGQRNLLKDPVLRAEKLVKGKMREFQLKRQAAQRAEQERLRREQVEADRIRRLEEAQRLADEGNEAAAVETLEGKAETPVAPPPPPPTLRAPKAKGSSSRKAWKIAVTDLPAFYRGIADGKIPSSCAPPVEGAIHRLVTAANGEVNYPGVYVEEDVMIVRGKK